MQDIRPYILNAHVNWLDDSNKSPHIVIKNGEGVQFPRHLHDVDMLSFNVSQESVRNLIIDKDGISFSARFNGLECVVFAPLTSIVKLHSKDMTISADIGIPDGGLLKDYVVDIPNTVAKLQLSIISGGISDDISRGKLSLV